MPRNQDSSKIGPVSGKISPSATLNAQSTAQIYRVYNTGKTACPVQVGSVMEGCSQDFGVNASTTVLLGASPTAPSPSDIEAVYEVLTSPGLRSGRFNKPGGAHRAIINGLGVGSLYRIFNTQKNGMLAITIGVSSPLDIANGSSIDLFVPGNVAVTVGSNDKGIYDFLAFAATAATVNSSVRSGHFKGPQTIASLTGNPQKAVYRISNSGKRDINYTGMPIGVPLKFGCSCDVEVAIGGALVVSNGPTGGGEIAGSYELLLIS